MAKIEGVEQLQKKLSKLAQKRQDCAVLVGYTAAYAIYVHEMQELHAGQPRQSKIGVYWGPSLYGPKFLEGPAREFSKDMAKLVADSAKKGLDLCQALLVAGLFLQRKSQERVPVEYGNLRASAFTRIA